MRISSLVSLVLASTFAFAAVTASAEEAAVVLGKSGKPLTAQQLRMKNCNAEAKAQSLKGEERKAFMSPCLKGEPKGEATTDTKLAAAPAAAEKAPTPAQLKRKACGEEAKSQGLKGEERKEFVRTCVRESRLSQAE